MNLFRSEEHVRRWTQFDPTSEPGIMPAATYAALFSHRMFRERLQPDYQPRLLDLRREWVGMLDETTGSSSFWQPRPSL